MKTNKFFLLAIILTIAFASCKKYEDGPTISLSPKKWRVVNVWKTDKTITNGVSQDGNDDNYIELKKDGKVINSWKIGTATFSDEGTWKFGDKHETIDVTYASQTTEYTILKLKENEMWVKTEGLGITTETHYISK